MFFFQLQGPFGDEHGEICVFDSVGFDQLVEELLDLLPDGVGPGPQNVAPRHVVVVNKSRLHYHVLIPRWEIHTLLGL